MDIAEKYLQDLHARFERDEISGSHFDKARVSLNDFVAKVGSGKRFTCIGELELEAYRNHTLSLPVSQSTGREISPWTAKGRLSAVRMMYRWAWELHLIKDLPRNLEGLAKVSLPSPKVEIFTMDELKTLWQNARDRLRCWIILALNCGFYQGDIADIRASEVDWDNAYIERNRSKTGVKARFALWDETMRLMRQEREEDAQGDDRLFLTRDGNPLAWRKIVAGRLTKSNTITSGFWKLQRKTGIDGGRSFSSLRNTGASMIERIDPLVTEMYLAHSVEGMKRHYAERDWGRLDRALGKMERKLRRILTA